MSVLAFVFPLIFYIYWLSVGPGGALIAIIPCDCWHGPTVASNTWHVTFAISFFVLMAIVILWFARKTINLLPERWRPMFTWARSRSASRSRS